MLDCLEMELQTANSKSLQEKTKRALLWMNLSHEPFVVLYVLLPFILRKNLDASILQISILSTLRPIMPVFSFYWSSNIKNRKNHLRSNLISAWILARLPFLLIPWVKNVWYLIFCCAIYELFSKSGIPALIEILKINIDKEVRNSAYMISFLLSFLESILLGSIIAWILDFDHNLWRWLIGFATLIGLTSVFFQLAVPIEKSLRVSFPKMKISSRIIEPWKEAISLLKQNSDFAKFQYGFMMGGFSLMFISPSLSVFYVDFLDLSHASVITGRSILMGVGIILSSWVWKKVLKPALVPQVTQSILLGFALYMILMILAQFSLGWFYLAFLFYGIAQAGSHLLWNLSGILFSSDGDSSPYSRLNILMLGLRGAVAPALGGICCNWLGPIPVFLIGIGVCLTGVLYMRAQLIPQEAKSID